MIGLAAWIAATAVSPLAHAQTDPLEARENQAIALRAEGRTQEALAVFQEVFEAGHLPRTQARLGLAETALGRWVSAETDLQTALDATGDPFISANRATLEATLATVRGHLGSLEVLCPQPGAEVWIEGRRAASLPMRVPLRLVAGSMPIEVRAEGHYPVVRNVTVAAGQLVRESVELMATQVVVAPTTPVPPTETQAPTRSPEGPIAHPDPSPSSAHTRRVAAAWMAGGAALMALGGGIALGVQRSVGTQFNHECSSMYDDALSDGCATMRSQANTSSALAVTGFALGGALAATAVVLLLLPSSGTGGHHARRAVCGPGLGTVGVACAATF